MPPIRARTATGAEISFITREEFGQAVASGRITPDWEVFHARGHRWLPVTVHPAFSTPVPAAAAPRGRTSDLVFIYPDFVPSANTVKAARPESDPFDTGPILAPDEIQRVLYAPRSSNPHSATATAEVDTAPHRISGPEQVRPLLKKALPALSKALIVAAGLVHTRIP